MEITEQEYDWIEKYLNGQLTEAENRAVEAQMKTDASFRQKVQYQMGVRAFFQHRRAELLLVQALDESVNLAESPTQQTRMRRIVLQFLPLVAMVALGLGLGWLLFGQENPLSPRGELLLSRAITRTVFPLNETGFDRSDSTVSTVVIQVYDDPEFGKNAFTYGNDSLTLYNVPPAIARSTQMQLTRRNDIYRLQTDDVQYRLRETKLGEGFLEHE